MLNINEIIKHPKFAPLPVLPLSDRIIISPIQLPYGESITSGGIILLDAKDERVFAVVVAIGADVPENDIAVGDIIYYNPYAAGDFEREEPVNGEIQKVKYKTNGVELFGHDYFYIRRRDVLGKYTSTGHITMIDNRLLVAPDAPTTVTIGGIYIPDDAQEIPVTGTVIAMGDKVSEVLKYYDVGCRIMYHKYGGVEVAIKIGNVVNKYLAIPEIEVMAIIEGK